MHSRFKVVTTLGFAGLLGFTTVVPAYADSPATQSVTNYTARAAAVQTVTVDASGTPTLQRADFGTTAAPQATTAVAKAATVQAAAVAPAAANTATTTTATGKATTTTAVATATAAVPASGNVSAFVQAALAQLGDRQDCTALVERSLRAIGYTVGDLGPMGFGRYGHAVDKSDAQYGDIMMRPGGGSFQPHVSIYLGNGQSVDGGYLGYQTVVMDDSPDNYTTIIRLG